MYRDEEEALGRSRWPGVGAGAAGQQRADCVRVAPAAPDVDQGADDRPNHVAQKAAAGYLIRHEARRITPSRTSDRPYRPDGVATDTAERGEVRSEERRVGKEA